MARHSVFDISIATTVLAVSYSLLCLTSGVDGASSSNGHVFNNINNNIKATTTVGTNGNGKDFRVPFTHKSLDNATFYNDVMRNLMHKPSQNDMKEERRRMSERMKERRENARLKIEELAGQYAGEYKPNPEKVQKLSMDDINKAKANPDDHPWVRRVAWGNGGNDQANGGVVDPSNEYDMWQQAYRFLGGYIDCDYDWSDDDHHSGDQEEQNNEDGEGGCARWMIWASYVNPNYQGNGYDEYYGDNPVSTLDCHNPNTDWELLGVYRQEFYQYIEQISKHLWAVDEYEYCVALSGLSYMTKYQCYNVGNDNNGNAIYASIRPTEYGRFQMGLYTDDYCIEPDDSLGMTYDDFGLTTSPNLYGSGDGDGNDDEYDSETLEWWYNTQEYTLTQLNEVYDRFRYCTSCVDFPTYQDGYFIGDYGTDDDDLINQCWKFWSHDSYTCGGDCLSKANAQGTILPIDYGGVTWGEAPSSFYSQASGDNGEIVNSGESRLTRLLANVFVTISFVIFVATFLAFAVARRSRYRESRSSKARRLLDGDGYRSSRSRRSSSRRRKSRDRDGDGIWKDSSSKSRKSSRSRKSSSRSKSRSRRTSTSGEADSDGLYRPPVTASGEERRSSSRKESSQQENTNDEF